MERMRCINASAFHPNAAGAKVYADAIIIRPLEPSTTSEPAGDGVAP